MARRNFWDSFYQGWEQGDKIDKRTQGLRQQAEFKKIAAEDQAVDTQYNPDDFMDEAEKAGGTWDAESQSYKLPDGSMQAPTNTPTYDEATKSYQSAQGESLKPKTQYSLGGKTQDVSFTPDEIQDYRNNKYADVYAANGDMDKAMGVRASAQSMKLGKLQYEQAAMQAEQAKNVNAIMKAAQGVASGKRTEEEGLSDLVNITDPMNKDGITHGYRAIGNGLYAVTEMKDNKIIGTEELNYDQILRRALKYASPDQYNNAVNQENKDRDYLTGRDDRKADDSYRGKVLDQSQAQFAEQQKLLNDKFIEDKRQFGEKIALENKEARSRAILQSAQAEYYRDGRGGGGAGKAKVLVGTTQDGKNILYNTVNGIVSEPMPAGMTKEDLFPKATGISPIKDMTVGDRLKLNEAVNAELEDLPDSVLEDPKALATAKQEIAARLLGIDNPTAQIPDYFGVAGEMEKEPGGLRNSEPKAKKNWYDRDQPKPVIQNGQSVTLSGNKDGAIIPRGLQMR